MLIFGSVVLSLLGIVAATGPVFYMTHHSIRHGHLASAPDDARPAARTEPVPGGWSVCPECKALIVDRSRHAEVAHHLAVA